MTNRTHIVLNQVRVPLSDFAAQGVDLSALRKLELKFGGAGHARRPARSSSPTCASRRRPRARRSTPTSSPTSPPTAPAPVLAPETGTTAAAVAAPQTVAAPSVLLCETASAAIASTRVIKRRLTVTGTTSPCAKARQGDGHEGRLEPQEHAARRRCARPGGQRRPRPSPRAATGVTVTAVATTGGKAATARSKTITVR